MEDYQDLIVYQKAYQLAMDIFEESRKFPQEEKFSLTNQIRRSSRSDLCELCRSLPEKKIRGPFRLKTFRLRNGEYRNRSLAKLFKRLQIFTGGKIC
jgi:hypothetical protein